jgi:hypothetical protein
MPTEPTDLGHDSGMKRRPETMFLPFLSKALVCFDFQASFRGQLHGLTRSSSLYPPLYQPRLVFDKSTACYKEGSDRHAAHQECS